MKKTKLAVLLAFATLTSCGGNNQTNTVVEEHTHTLISHSEVLPTCTSDGTKAYYSCSGCDLIFSDKDGEIEIKEIEVIPATGHSINEDNGKCNSCDYDEYSALVFTPNEEENPTYYTISSNNKEATYIKIAAMHHSLPVKEIEANAFKDRSKLAKIEIGENITTIGNNAFENCSLLDNITLPDNVTTVNQDAFKNCKGLVCATLSKNLTVIPQGMFYSATNLRKVEISTDSALTTIGEGAFGHCNRLQSVTIPALVTEISEKDTFKNCFNLVEIKNLSSLEIKNDTDENKAKYGELTSYAKNIFTATEGESILSTIGDWTFFTLKETDSETNEIKEVKYLLNSSGMHKESMVTPTLKEAGSTYKFVYSAFKDDNNIKSITISDGVVEFGDIQVFSFSGVENVYISDSVTSYSTSAFWGASQLKSIRLSKEATYLNTGLLGYTTSLKSLIIPAKVNKIAKQAFQNSGIETIYYESSKEDWDKIQINTNGNDPFTAATKYYYSEEEPTENKSEYWHYDSDGVTPMLWENN